MAGVRRLAVGRPHHDREFAPERDAHRPAARGDDRAAVQGGGHVVGVALQLGGGGEDAAPGGRRRLAPLHVRRDEAGDPRRAREAEPAAAGELCADRDRTAAAVGPERAHRRMGLGRGLTVVAHLDPAIERDRDRVERRTEVGRRRRHPHQPVAHVRSLARIASGTALPSNRATSLCETRCNAVAAATFTFDADEVTVWLDAPADGGARAGELCERHARTLTPPQGWRLEDRPGRAGSRRCSSSKFSSTPTARCSPAPSERRRPHNLRGKGPT